MALKTAERNLLRQGVINLLNTVSNKKKALQTTLNHDTHDYITISASAKLQTGGQTQEQSSKYSATSRVDIK
jgi:hypothetical protein